MESSVVIYWRKPSEVSPRDALVVAFMPLHSVSKCIRCFKHVYIPCRLMLLHSVSCFSEYFSIFRKPKSIYLRYFL
jgi:hypothetical protein